MKLICLTYAGGNKYSYRNFRPYIHKEIEMITLELPGRGSRVSEPFVYNLNFLVDDLYLQIQDYLSEDYMMFGHSMGAVLGDLLIHKLEKNFKPLPVSFLVTGCRSPRKNTFKPKIHHLSKEAFQKEIIELGGMPDEIIKNKEALDYLLEILKVDITALETNEYIEKSKYNVPIIAIRGSEERITEEEIIDWKKQTSSTFKYHVLEGNHFFILKHLNFISEIININLLKSIRPSFK
jgi:surfactin synthase thioesterase subunit